MVALDGGPAGPSGVPITGSPIQLAANVVDPSSVNAVSKFGSCVGHPYPSQTSPNSGKNYFWPTSTNFSTTTQIRLYAACDGVPGQSQNDLGADTPYRGQTLHLFCDHSSTSLRYFHVNYSPAIIGQPVHAGDFLGYAYILSDGLAPAGGWQTSNNFDIAVSDSNDTPTVDYFAKLSASAMAAWAARGLTSVSQTMTNGAACASYTANVGQLDIFVFTPPL